MLEWCAIRKSIGRSVVADNIYTDTRLTLERLPAFLYSDSFAMAPIIDGEAIQFEEAGGDGVEEPSLVAELMRQVRQRGANSYVDSSSQAED